MRTIAVVIFSMAGCFSPSFVNGKTPCSSNSDCPSGLHCAADRTCWHNGSDPTLDMSLVPSDMGENVDLATSTVVFPPAAVWISAGGGSAAAAASQIGITFGGGTTILGESVATSGATCSFGMLSSGEN